VTGDFDGDRAIPAEEIEFLVELDELVGRTRSAKERARLRESELINEHITLVLLTCSPVVSRDGKTYQDAPLRSVRR